MADFVKIAEVVTSGSQATISFGSIPATYRNLEMVVSGRVTTAGVAVTNLLLQFNGDTGANYDSNRWTRFGQATFRASTSAVITEIAAATNATNVATSSTLFIPEYRGTTFQKTFSAVSAGKVGASADSDITGMVQGAGFWRSTSAISSILLSIVSGNFVDGSVASLYGKM